MATVVVSVLFTDLVGSTDLSSRLGADRSDRVRIDHFTALRRALDHHGGHEVKNVGDGIMAVFGSVGESLDAAVAMQKAIARHGSVELPDGTAAPLAMRVGLAVGDCVEEDGDYFGEPVVLAARLCAAAVGGQILVSETVRGLAPRGRHELVHIGPVSLKGLPEAVDASEVTWIPDDGPVVAPLQDRLVLPDPVAFVGRAAERETLRAAYRAAAAQGCRVVLVSGEAGQGKTRLSIEAAREAAQSGAMALYGRCDPEVAVPYRPWVEMLEHWAVHATDDDLDALDPRHLAELTRLVPALRGKRPVGASLDGWAPSDPTPTGETAAGDQYVLFGAVAGALAAVSEARPVVLVLDDLHWADRGTLQLLRHVAITSPRAHLLIVGTYRDTDVDRRHAVTDLVTSLHRDAELLRVELAGLSDDAVLAYVDHALAEAEGRGGADSPWSDPTTRASAVALARALADETGGNPFFVGELLRHLLESGTLGDDPDQGWVLREDLAESDLPNGVREVVAARVRRLGDRADETLAAASVLGRDFDLATLASVLDEDVDEVYGWIEPAVAAQLVVELDATGDRLSFVHAIVQHSLYRGMTAGRRARLHRRAAEVLEHSAGADQRRCVEEVAHHLFAGLRRAELDRAVPAAERAAECALASSAPDQAARWFRRALDVVEAGEPPDEARRGRLLVRLGEAERDAGTPAFREHLLEAAAIARELDDDELLVDAAIANHRGIAASSVSAVDHERVAVLESALDAVGPEDRLQRALVLGGLAGELIFSGEQRRFDLAEEAVEVARRTGDPQTLVLALHRAAAVADVPRWYGQRHRWVEEAMGLTSGQGDPMGRFLTLTGAIRDEMTLGHVDAAERAAAEAQSIATEIGRPMMLWHIRYLRSTLTLVRGDLVGAEELAESALRVAVESGQPDSLLTFGAQLMQVRWHQGRTGELVDLLVDSVEEHPDMSALATALAYVQSVAGDRAAGAALLAQLRAGGFRFREDWNWGITCGLAAQTAHELHDAESARLLIDILAPYRHLILATSGACLPAVTHYLGLITATLGRPDEAEALLDDALARHQAMRSPFLTALTELELARLVATHDPQRASALSAEVRATAEKYGFEGLRVAASSGPG